MERRPLPSEYELFPWVELRPEERADILTRQRAAEWYPETLSPFPEEERIEPVSSLGLRFHGQVVGWCITHRMKPDTIRFFRLFIRRDLQPMGGWPPGCWSSAGSCGAPGPSTPRPRRR
jgi:hypothetical protein